MFERLIDIAPCCHHCCCLLLAAGAAGSESAISRVTDAGGVLWVFRGHLCLDLGLASNSEIRDSVITGSFDEVEVKLGDGAIVA